MTVETTELTVLDLLAGDEVEHWICCRCYPGYVEGKIVEALCGELTNDIPEGTEWKDPVCERCDRTKFCPQCGQNMLTFM